MGRWSSLRDLSLDHNNITCKGAHAVFTQLSTAPIGGLSLETCDLSFNRVGDSGARRMALTLAQHNSSVGQGLRVLNLRGNRIGDWGAGWLSLVVRNSGAAGCSLEMLDVSDNPRITLSGGLAELSMACRQTRQTLELDGVVLAVGLGGLTLKVSLERPRLHTEESFQSPLDATEATPVKVLKTSPTRGLIGLSEEHIGRKGLLDRGAPTFLQQTTVNTPIPARSAVLLGIAGLRRHSSASDYLPVEFVGSIRAGNG
ncbi:hypothetical protein FOZ62_020562 [Perkinsus olseni]|uniref:Uncharacterized protein n=1 Tax=Perkinsus olseni TaxID=32597 RepID=A0A7J6QQL0_PEROL|nr:hypothetical protein FOZ62_020562 [Perkinsus olseni]